MTSFLLRPNASMPAAAPHVTGSGRGTTPDERAQTLEVALGVRLAQVEAQLGNTTGAGGVERQGSGSGGPSESGYDVLAQLLHHMAKRQGPYLARSPVSRPGVDLVGGCADQVA
jgi:hypothetical protein